METKYRSSFSFSFFSFFPLPTCHRRSFTSLVCSLNDNFERHDIFPRGWNNYGKARRGESCESVKACEDGFQEREAVHVKREIGSQTIIKYTYDEM